MRNMGLLFDFLFIFFWRQGSTCFHRFPLYLFRGGWHTIKYPLIFLLFVLNQRLSPIVHHIIVQDACEVLIEQLYSEILILQECEDMKAVWVHQKLWVLWIFPIVQIIQIVQKRLILETALLCKIHQVLGICQWLNKFQLNFPTGRQFIHWWNFSHEICGISGLVVGNMSKRQETMKAKCWTYTISGFQTLFCAASKL